MTTLALGILSLLNSCGGYRVRTKGNPFAEHGIKSVAIPMFVNESVYPKANVPFTREIKTLLAGYPGLEISTSPNAEVDALLIGIVESDNRYTEAYKTTATNFQSGSTIGNRAGLYVPTASQFKIQVRVMLIKDPTIEDQKLFKSKWGEYMDRHPKVVFNRSFSYTGSFNRDARPTDTSDSGGIVNYTNTRRYFDQTLQSLAESNARDFEELVINVF
tara:strand:- start:208106 stop:208756 length:651 start_codon:yes stop_codon:yes gene_type:complete